MTYNSHTHKDEYMHEFTHSFAIIFKLTFSSAHSRSKTFFKACNGAECKAMII